MNWQQTLEKPIQKYILDHEGADIRELALKKFPENWPKSEILNQIKSRRKAKAKIADWLNCKDLVFPDPDVMEQASSRATALYKANLLETKNVLDLTAGVGIDLWAFAQYTNEITGIEKEKNTADILAHNVKALNLQNANIENASAEAFVQTCSPYNLIYADPARRTKNQKGLKHLSDGSPNILQLLPTIRNKAKYLMIKTSPMLDIDQTNKALGQCESVHCVEYEGECKEVLYILNFEKPSDQTSIHVACLDENGAPLRAIEFTRNEEESASIEYSKPQKYLYEPGPAFLKSGAFKVLAKRHNLKKLHKHTHLYTSEKILSDFPGKLFEVLGVLPVKIKNLPFKKANLAIRNFPMKTEDLRKKLKIKEGGHDMLFACTLSDKTKALVHCIRV